MAANGAADTERYRSSEYRIWRLTKQRTQKDIGAANTEYGS
jgi:hypothetical protein